MTKKGFYNFRFFDGISNKLQSNQVIRINGDRIAGIDDPEVKKSFPDKEGKRSLITTWRVKYDIGRHLKLMVDREKHSRPTI
jgi:hypothetical protein